MTTTPNLSSGLPVGTVRMVHPEHGSVVVTLGDTAPDGERFMDYFRRGYRTVRAVYVAGTNGRPDHTV